MKALKISSFLLVGIIGVQAAFAQDEIKFGVRAGLNLAEIERSGSYSYERESFYNGTSNGKSSRETTSDESYRLGNLIGFQVGAVADIKIADFLYVQPGIMLSSKGTEYEETEEYTREGNNYGGGTSKETYKINFKINPYYIDVPILLSLKGTLAEGLALRAQAGPYLGFGLFGGAERSDKYESFYNGIPSQNANPENGAKKKIKNVFSITDEEKEEFGGMLGDGLSRFNCGLSFGVGIEYSNFYLGVSYNYGLTSLTSKYDYYDDDGYSIEKGSSEENAYERTLSITLGYNF